MSDPESANEAVADGAAAKQRSIPWTRLMVSAAALAVLFGVHALTTPSGELTELTVLSRQAQPEGEQLAERVRYSDSFSVDGGAIQVLARGASGSAEVALVSPDHPVRIRHLDVPGDAVFADVAPGEWSLRVYARGRSGEVQVRAERTGSSTTLLGSVAVLVLAPLFWSRWR